MYSVHWHNLPAEAARHGPPKITACVSTMGEEHSGQVPLAATRAAMQGAQYSTCPHGRATVLRAAALHIMQSVCSRAALRSNRLGSP